MPSQDQFEAAALIDNLSTGLEPGGGGGGGGGGAFLGLEGLSLSALKCTRLQSRRTAGAVTTAEGWTAQPSAAGQPILLERSEVCGEAKQRFRSELLLIRRQFLRTSATFLSRRRLSRRRLRFLRRGYWRWFAHNWTTAFFMPAHCWERVDSVLRVAANQAQFESFGASWFVAGVETRACWYACRACPVLLFTLKRA